METTSPPRSKGSLIRLFTVSKPYALQYRTLGRERQRWLSDKPALDELIKEGTVKVEKQNRNTILYVYTPTAPSLDQISIKKIVALLHNVTMDINSCEVEMHKVVTPGDNDSEEMKSMYIRLGKLWTEAYHIKQAFEKRVVEG